MIKLKEEFKKLAGDSGVYGLSRAGSMSIGIILVPIFTRIFQPDEYGVIDVLSVTMLITVMFLNLGMNEANFLFFLTAKNEEDKVEIASTTLFFRLIVITLFSFASYSLSGPISRALFKTNEHEFLVRIMMLTIPFSIMHTYFLDLLRCRFEKWKYTLVSTGLVLAMASLNIFFVVYMRMGLKGVVCGNFLANVSFMVIGFFLVRKNFILRLSLPLLKKMLVYGIPLIPSSLSFWLIRSANRFFLIRFASIEDIGIYTVACKLSALIDFINIAFIIGWAPFCVSVSHKPDIRRFYAKVLLYYSMLICFLMLVVTTFSYEILSVAATPDYISAHWIVGPLCFMSTGYGIYYISNLGLTLTKKTYHITWCVIIAALICIVMNWLTIPAWGISGAAYSSVTAFAILNVLIFIMAQRYYTIPYEFGKAILIFVGCGGLMVLGTMIRTEVLYHRLLLKTGVVALYPILLYACRIVDDDERRFIRGILGRRPQARV